VHDVMRVAVAQLAARNPARAVTVLECSPDRYGHRARAPADVQRSAVRIVRHYDTIRIARQAAGRFRENARTARQRSLTIDSVLAQCIGVDMHDDFERTARRSRRCVHQRLLGDNAQRIGASLSSGTRSVA